MYDTTKSYSTHIKDLIKTTWQTPYLEVKEGIYATFEKKFSYPEVDHTDGIGTKGAYHWQKRTFREAVLDGLAMNLNDLLLVGAVPYKLQNHIIIPRDDHEAILEIVGALAEECKKRDIAITGGETSIHNNTEGLDISMTISGFIPKPFHNQFKVGDTLVGLPSNGLHSNGFTKVRELFGDEFREEFTAPTAIYSDKILPLLTRQRGTRHPLSFNGMMHITGGAYTKLGQILPPNADAVIKNINPQPIFHELYKRGVSDEEMYKTFNCGTGFVFSAMPEEAKAITAAIEGAAIIGGIVTGSGKIKIRSAFGEKEVLV